MDGSLVGGAIQMQVYEGEARVTTAAGSNGSVIHLDQGAANVFSQGADTIYAGAGDVSVIVSGTANVYAGTGTFSVYGRSDAGGANVYGTDGDYLISGDSGNITYHGRQGQHCRGSAFQHHAARRRRPPHHQWWITRHRCWRLGRRRLQ